MLNAVHDAVQGALAIVSGRPLAELDHFIDLPHVPMAGQHGLEWRDAFGCVSRMPRLSLSPHIVQASDPSRLMLQPGSFVVEIRCRGGDKGDIVNRLLRDRPFLGRRPVFIGDDLTDEHGFAAASRGGGFGILVGGDRETGARHRLPGPAAVKAWLRPLAGVAA